VRAKSIVTLPLGAAQSSFQARSWVNAANQFVASQTRLAAATIKKIVGPTIPARLVGSLFAEAWGALPAKASDAPIVARRFSFKKARHESFRRVDDDGR
jgi:hypothetical protein